MTEPSEEALDLASDWIPEMDGAGTVTEGLAKAIDAHTAEKDLRIADLENTLFAAQQEVISYGLKNQGLEKERDKAMDLFERSHGTYLSAASQRDELKAKVERLERNQALPALERLQKHARRVIDLKAQVEHLESETSRLQAVETSLNDAVDRLQKERDEEIENHKATAALLLDALKERDQAIRMRDDLARQCDEIEEQAETLEKERDELQKQNSELDHTVAEGIALVDGLRKQNERKDRLLSEITDALANNLDDDMRSDDWHDGVEAASQMVATIIDEAAKEALADEGGE